MQIKFDQKMQGKWYVDRDANADTTLEFGISRHSPFIIQNSFYYQDGVITNSNIKDVRIVEPEQREEKIVTAENSMRIWYVFYDEHPGTDYKIQGLNKKSTRCPLSTEIQMFWPLKRAFYFFIRTGYLKRGDGAWSYTYIE
ncbi:hypothetical protein QA612_21810 [Evansella sp. AB-P1]|uniref:hypothetical protein n=1 Tax=Evansella sp. AB-P1 TaxID=3037653 RepID=UPI00241E2EB8|nr:hypothetical protein [Evansella sp. AB-P1]MDG5790081.1 hypothetical protein [Evansella sp. AB-P1]